MMFTIKVTLDDGRIIESPPMDLHPDEDIYDIAEDIAEKHEKRTNFLHIDGGLAVQKLIPMGKIVSVDVLKVNEDEGTAGGRANKGKLQLVKTKTP